MICTMIVTAEHHDDGNIDIHIPKQRCDPGTMDLTQLRLPAIHSSFIHHHHSIGGMMIDAAAMLLIELWLLVVGGTLVR